MNREKKTAEEIYLKNEELENYFANTIIPQLFVDANFILRKFTPPAMRHFSLTDADLNRNINEVKENIRYPTLDENIKEVIATGEILEKEVQTTDGKWFQMNILPYKVHKENRTNGVIITFVDITKRIQNLKELEKLNAAHDTLMYALSHDIKQPLAAIVLLTEGLTMAYDQRKTEQFYKWTEMLKSSITTIRSLLNDFIKEHETQPQITSREERVNIENIVNEVLTSLKIDLHNPGIQFTTEFHTSEIIFSRNNIRSIVYNLINNALKYKKPDSRLEIIISTLKTKEFVVLQVKDNGLGIAKEHQKKIFEKATRIHPYIEGTGMGLYIIKRMVEDKGGKVEVESSPGEGAVFSVYFKSGYQGEILK